MANGTEELATPGETGLSITQMPLGQDLTPEPIKPPKFELATPGESGVEELGFNPVNLISDIPSFTPEVSRQRDIYRKYGVDVRPGVNLEGTAGRLQSNFSKWTNGIVKGVGTAGTTFLEPFVDIFVGTPTAIATGKFSGFYDNAGSKVLDNINEYLREELPNFYTQAEKDYGFARTLGTANFWADQGMQGLGFLVGAIGSGMAVGSSGVIGAGARATTLGSLKTWRNITNAFRGKQLAKGSSDILRIRDILGRVNYSAQAANVFGAGLISAFGEAGIEARETRRRSIATMQNLRAIGDERYANMTDQDIQDLADSAGNVAFGLNTAIVGASNIYQFGKLFSRSWKSTSNRYLTNRIQQKGSLKYEFKDLPTRWKRAYQVANWFKRPAAEAFEEWSQAAINIGAEDYFKDVYSGDPISDLSDMLEGSVGVLGSLFEGYMEAPQVKEGQQAIFLGALLGKLGEAGSSIREDGMTSRQEWLDTYDRTKKLAETLNNLDPQGKLYQLLKGYNESAKAQQGMDKALEVGDIFSFKNKEAIGMFSIIDSFINAGKIEDLKSFVKDIGKLSEEEFKEVIGIDLDVKIKSPAEQTRIIENRIARIEENKPKNELFLSTLPDNLNLSVEDKIELSTAMTYYGYMGDVMDQRETELAAEISELSNGIVSWDSVKNLKTASAEMAKRLAEMHAQYAESPNSTEINKAEIAAKLRDLGKIKEHRAQTLANLNKIANPETIKKAKKAAKEKKNKAEVSNKSGEQVKSEVLSSKDNDIIEAVEDDIEKTADERVNKPELRREQIGTKRQRKLMRRQRELEEMLNNTPAEEQAEFKAELEKINKALKQGLEKVQQDIPGMVKESIKQTFPEQEAEEKAQQEQNEEVERLIELEERGVDVEATENIPIGNLLPYPNASIIVRFNGEEGILFKDNEGSTVFEDQNGNQTVIGNFIDDQTLDQVDVEALLDQTGMFEIRLIADGRTFEINGEYYNNLYSNPLMALDQVIFEDSQTPAQQVTLHDSENNRVVFTSPFIVQELSRLITMIELVKQEAISEMEDFDPDTMTVEYNGKEYIVEEDRSGVSSVTVITKVFDENLKEVKNPNTKAEIIKTRDAFIERYIQNKINAYINEYEQDIFGTQPDASTTPRSEEDVKQDAKESSSERIGQEDIGDNRKTPNKTNKQATAKSKQDEIDRGNNVIDTNDLNFVTDTDQLDELGIDLGDDPITELFGPAEEINPAPIINVEDSIDAVNDVIEEAEVPSNMDVASTNTQQNNEGSDMLGNLIVPLKTIQSLAWKSANHPDNDGVIVNKLVQDLTKALETTTDNAGVELEFSIDLNDPQLTDIEEMQPILAKLKKGVRLTQDEISRVAMRVSMTIDGNTVYAYIHRTDYIDNHIKEDEQKAARALLIRDRIKIYEDFLAGKKTKSSIKNMTGGHLVTERGTVTSPAELNTDKRTNGAPKIFFAANTSYIDESDQEAFPYVADPSLNGAIFMSLPMLNGKSFPLRLYVSDISRDTASLVYAIYRVALSVHNGNISKNMPIKSFNTIKDRVKDNPMLKDYVSLVESTMVSQEVGPTYKQMLDLLMFQGAKTKTKTSPTIVSGKGKLRLGDLEITKENYTSSREQIIDWISKNKRHHVSKSYVNSKIEGSAYNNWLFKHGIVFTDAVTTDNGTSFIQPTIRYAPLKSEAPAAEKESPKPIQPKPARKNIAKMTGGFQSNMTAEDAAALGISLDALGIEPKNAFDLDDDLGAPTKKTKSDITKSQEDQNCK